MRKTHKDEIAREALDRRGFLKAVGGAGSLAAAVVVAPLGEAEASETADEKVKARYRETEHVQAFYRTKTVT